MFSLRQQVFDEEGVERTPKSLLALRSNLTHQPQLGSATQEPGTPTSEMSDNFLERMSSTGFSHGMFSASGTVSPISSDGSDHGRDQDENAMVLEPAELIKVLAHQLIHNNAGCRS